MKWKKEIENYRTEVKEVLAVIDHETEKAWEKVKKSIRTTR